MDKTDFNGVILCYGLVASCVVFFRVSSFVCRRLFNRCLLVHMLQTFYLKPV